MRWEGAANTQGKKEEMNEKNFSRTTWTAKITVKPETWRWDNITINSEDRGYEGVMEINVPQDKGQCKHGNEPYW